MPRTADAHRPWSIPSGSAIDTVLRASAARARTKRPAVSARRDRLPGAVPAGSIIERIGYYRTSMSSENPALAGVFVHPHALCESVTVGEKTRVWAFAHVLTG